MSTVKFGKIGKKINWVRRYLMYGPRSDTLTYVRRLNRLGARIDESLYMPAPELVLLDDTTPWLLEIGRNVGLAAGVRILTHDASWLMMKAREGVIRGHMAPVKIGNNVFVGMGAVIQCGVTICDNVIISTNSIVSSSIREPGVYAGTPARQVATYERFLALREARQIREAYVLAREYYRRFGVRPPQEVFHEYFWIFAPRKLEELSPVFLAKLGEHNLFEKSKQAFLESQPDFEGYDAFWRWCLHKIEGETRGGQAAGEYVES